MKLFVLTSIFIISAIPTLVFGLGNKTNKIINDPKVKDIYQKCKDSGQANTDQTMGQCLKAGLEADGTYDEIVKKYFGEENVGQNVYSDDSVIDDKEERDLRKKVKNKRSDPAVKKLEEYLSKRLQEALYGKASGGRNDANPIRVVDPKKFFDLYQSQLSNSFLSTFSSFCLEAKLRNDSNSEDGNLLISKNEKERAKQREENLKNLKNQISSAEGAESRKITKDTGYDSCLTRVDDVCYKTKTHFDAEDLTEDQEYTKRRACVVTDQIKKIRQALLETKDIKEKIDEFNAQSVAFGRRQAIPKNQVVSFSGEEKGKTIGDLTSITSNEFANKSGYVEEKQKMTEELNKLCIENGIQDQEKCSKFTLDENETQILNKQIDDLEARKLAIKQKFTELKGSEAQIRDFLKNEGRTDAEIDQLLEKGPDQIAKTIADEFEAEKQAIIDSLNKVKEVRGVASVDPQNPNSQAQKPDLEKVKDELMEDAVKYKEIIHFNNIITGYLETVRNKEDENGEIVQERGVNTAALLREVNDSAYDAKNQDEDQRNPANNDGYNQGDFNQIKETLAKRAKENPEQSTGDEKSPVSIGTDVINKEFLNYDTKFKDPEK